MKYLLEQLFESNKDSKYIKSSEEIEKIFTKMFSFSLFKVVQKQIKEILGDSEIIFGLEETSSGFIFTPDFFIIVGIPKGIIKYNYFFLSKIKTRKKSFTKSGSYLLDDKEIIPLGTKSDDYFEILNQIKVKISEVDFTNEIQDHRNTQHRSTTLTPLGLIINKVERFKENEMNPLEIDEIQKNFNLQVLNIDNLNFLIKSNEQTIVGSERGLEYLQKFIRLKKYIESIQLLIEGKLNESKNEFFLFKSNLLVLLKEIEDLNKVHKTIYLVSIVIINQYVNKEMMDFFENYELLDKLGVFNSEYENQVLNKLSSIENKLSSINSKLSHMNVLLSYNTYQLHLLRK